MNRRQRLMATLRGEAVDHPAVCFYEINGLDEFRGWQDPYNIYAHPSWQPILELARDRTDRIVMRSIPWRSSQPDPLAERTRVETWTDNGSRYERTTIQTPRRTLTALSRRDPDVNTVWQIEHLLKDCDDLRAYLDLPIAAPDGDPDITGVLATEAELGDTGIVMIDTSDPICQAAALFHMQDYTVIASTEPALFHALLERFTAHLLARTTAIAQALPGRLWRIYGPEYSSPPYLHPRLFREYVTRYDTPMVQAIQQHGGFARIHSHGNLRRILPDIAATGCTALDPIEPPPQGDVSLQYVREHYGDQMVLFGNLEASDLETLPTTDFERKIRQALQEGVGGRGFVLMPSSCPYGRILPDLARRNYEKMVEIIETANF